LGLLWVEEAAAGIIAHSALIKKPWPGRSEARASSQRGPEELSCATVGARA